MHTVLYTSVLTLLLAVPLCGQGSANQLCALSPHKAFNPATLECVDGTETCETGRFAATSAGYRPLVVGSTSDFPPITVSPVFASWHEACHRTTLDQPISYIGSAAWSQAGQSILAYLPAQSKLISIDLNGAISEAPAIRLPEGRAIAQIVQAGTLGISALTRDKSLFLLDTGFGVARYEGSFSDPRSVGPRISTAVNWIAHQSQIYVVGAMQTDHIAKPDSSAQFGFVTAGWPGTNARPPILISELNSSFWQHYLMGNQYLARTKGSIFFLQLSDINSIVRISLKDGRIESFPIPLAPFRYTKPISGVSGIEGAARLAQTISAQSAIHGLFSDQDWLYILTKRISEGSPIWQLHQIDPISGRHTGTATIPSTANRLTTIQSVGSWIFLEQDPMVAENGKLLQPTRSLLSFPRRWIERPEASPLYRSDQAVSCAPSETKNPWPEGETASSQLIRTLSSSR